MVVSLRLAVKVLVTVKNRKEEKTPEEEDTCWSAAGLRLKIHGQLLIILEK